MKAAYLARCQKRLKHWEAVSTNLEPGPLQSLLIRDITLYKNLIAKCWEFDSISPSDEAALKALETRLVGHEEESRLAAAPSAHQ